jgi:hypothetical protein
MKYLFVFILFSCSSLAATYHVGNDQEIPDPNRVPWEILEAGDSVLIHYREEPYRSKWVICRQGTHKRPIVIKGVPGQGGARPMISGVDAETREELNFWNESRGIIKIGGANNPSDLQPRYIVIDGLDISGGRPPYKFTGRDGETEYVNNCAAIYIEKGDHIRIRNCTLHDCGNGIFAGNLASDLVVEYCRIFDNGIPGRYLEHNNYTEVYGILFQFNDFGPLKEGSDGNNLKDRSAGCIIRQNQIEGGNRQLDLVESKKPEFVNSDIYRKTYVFKNTLIEHDGEGNRQIIHYGGDGGDESNYRRGELLLFNNTIVSDRKGRNTLVRLSGEGEYCRAWNNIIYVSADPAQLAVLNGPGTIDLENNFIRPGWKSFHSDDGGRVNDLGNIEENDPRFVDFGEFDLRLKGNSPCINTGLEISEYFPTSLAAKFEYIDKAFFPTQPVYDEWDLGAYEFRGTISVGRWAETEEVRAYPNPFSEYCRLDVPDGAICVVVDGFGRQLHRGTGDFEWRPGPEVPAGSYYVIISTMSHKYTAKIQYLK